MLFGERLKQLREAAGMSQPVLATKCKLSVWTLRGWEQGKREPSWRHLLDVASVLGVDPREFDNCEGVHEIRNSGTKKRNK